MMTKQRYARPALVNLGLLRRLTRYSFVHHYGGDGGDD
jgi:hypothetical protein